MLQVILLLASLALSAAQAQTPITKDITEFGAPCNNNAFLAFNAWAIAQNAPITLTIPSGMTCVFDAPGTGGNWFAKGIKKLVVSGYGATLSDNNGTGNGFFGGGIGVRNDDQHSARIATVNAGASTVMLLNKADASKFKVGSWALVTGLDMMGYGYPPNPAFFDFVQITRIAATGRIYFAAPLKNAYKSTWPLYNAGDFLGADQGGPATLYALDPSWDTEVEYQGLTISQEGQTYANGRSVTYRDVTFTGQACAIPTQNLLWQAINTKMDDCAMEVDKLVGTMVLNGVTIRQIMFQSSSIDLLTMDGSTVRNLNGTPRRAVILNSKITNFGPGTLGYGKTDEVVCRSCVLENIAPYGVGDNGGLDGVGVNVLYSMSNGVIRAPRSEGPMRWAIPGANVFWTAQYENEGAPFQVLDVTKDDNYTYVKTSLTGGFPSVIPYQGQKIYLRVHPAPRFTCTNCTGSADAVDLSQAPAGAPIYSYSKRTYTGAIGANQPRIPLWGSLVKLKVSVKVPYTGTLPSLPTDAMYANALKASDWSYYAYDPVINLKIAGERLITPTAVTGAKAGDSVLSVPGAIWFTDVVRPHMDADISAECNASPSKCPTITIEATTNQGVRR